MCDFGGIFISRYPRARDSSLFHTPGAELIQSSESLQNFGGKEREALGKDYLTVVISTY